MPSHIDPQLFPQTARLNDIADYLAARLAFIIASYPPPQPYGLPVRRDR